MQLVSWNVNGIRASMEKGLADFVMAEKPDILCLQEIKARAEQVQLPLAFAGYHSYWNSAVKPGYSGTAIFSKEKPDEILYGLGNEEHDQEGRVITAVYSDFSLVTVYTPNSQDELRRLSYRMRWDADFLSYVKMLEKEKKRPVIFCGDLNVSHREIDLARPKDNRKNAGFTDEERAGFDAMLEKDFIDTFRHFFPDRDKAYSWWSYRAGARVKNVGWRLDYFLASAEMQSRLKHAHIHAEILGSDHCPVSLKLDF